MFSPVYVILFLHSILCNAEGKVTFDVTDFGAIPEGLTDATQPFLNAWASACRATDNSTIYVPKGQYLIKYAEFRGPCKSRIKVRIDGTLIAPPDFHALGNTSYWILFIKVNWLSVIGGDLNANGAALWACKNSGAEDCTVGARSITFNWVNNGKISGLTSINSQLMHLVINSCNNISVSNVTLMAPGQSPNTDGIHVQSSNRVTITNTIIRTGDDCISIGPGTTNLWMEKIQCGPGHGVSIGSLGRNFEEAAVQNVTLINSIFEGSDNGLRIKTWARPSNGSVTNVSFRNIVMKDVDNPIIIDQNYCPYNHGCPDQTSGIKIDQVTYQNILGTSSTQVAMFFNCSSTSPCSSIKLRDIRLTYLNVSKAQSFCNNIINGTYLGVILPDNCLETYDWNATSKGD